MFSLKASATPDQDVHRLSPGAGGLATSMVRGCRWLARLGRSGDINGPRMWLAGPAREGRRHQWSADVVGGPDAGGPAMRALRTIRLSSGLMRRLLCTVPQADHRASAAL